MAALDVTQKTEIYHILYQINAAFAAIVGCFDRLQQAGVTTSKFTRELQGFTQELQSEFNQDFLLDWHQTEFDDWNRFGKVRQAQEKRLRDPDDVFIHARERQQELAKERRKSGRKLQTNQT
jgi:hypothetical protein